MWRVKPNWDSIEQDYMRTDLSMAKLAEKHDVNASTLRGRARRGNWKKSGITEPIVSAEIDTLNDRHKLFCSHYLVHFNGTKAYQSAYPDATYDASASGGSRLLRRPDITEELNRLKKEQRDELFVDSIDIMKAYRDQAFADITDYIEFGQEEYEKFNNDSGEMETKIGSYVRLKPDTEVDGTLIQEVRQGRDGVVVKLYDKQKALAELQALMDDTSDSAREIIVIKDDWAGDSSGKED